MTVQSKCPRQNFPGHTSLGKVTLGTKYHFIIHFKNNQIKYVSIVWSSLLLCTLVYSCIILPCSWWVVMSNDLAQCPLTEATYKYQYGK